MKYGKALTWDELANLYDEEHTNKARTQPMDGIRKWAILQTDRFYVNDELEGTIHLILEEDMTDETIVGHEEALPPNPTGVQEAADNLAGKTEVITTEEVQEEKKQAKAVTTVEIDLTGANPLSVEMTAEFMKAYEALSSGKVPPEVIEKREGPGGILFSYVPHWWVSRQLRLALGPLWDYEVLEITCHNDNSVSAKGTLTVHLPLPDGTFHPSKITAVGTFVDGFKNMKVAYKEASAASRLLAKLVQLRFGIGEEFYAGEDDGIPEQTPAMAFATLKRYGIERGLTEEEIVAAFKNDEAIVFESLPEKAVYQYAYTVVGKMIREKKSALETEGAEGF